MSRSCHQTPGLLPNDSVLNENMVNVDTQRRLGRPLPYSRPRLLRRVQKMRTAAIRKSKTKTLSRTQEKGKISKSRDTQIKRLSPDPFPVARRSNSDRQSGNSPGFSSSRPDAFPCSRTVASVGRSLSQWRDRAGFQPASLLSLSTPDPINMNL